MQIKRKTIIWGSLIILCVWAISGALILLFLDKDSRGSFGDMFGAINALFSGLALFGIIISILIQQRELNLQRDELTNTRKEFQINRITNVLFKQIEQVNNLIDRVKFTTIEEVPVHTSITVTNFSTILYELDKYHQEKNYPQKFIEKNSDIITQLITSLHGIYDNLNDILNFDNLDKNEVESMRKIFGSNINPNLFPILIEKRKNINFKLSVLPLSVDSESLEKLERPLLEMELLRINEILEFSKK